MNDAWQPSQLSRGSKKERRTLILLRANGISIINKEHDVVAGFFVAMSVISCSIKLKSQVKITYGRFRRSAHSANDRRRLVENKISP